ncbi:MAG: hypothetical protein FD129_2507, partial [bacterium]
MLPPRSPRIGTFPRRAAVVALCLFATGSHAHDSPSADWSRGSRLLLHVASPTNRGACAAGNLDDCRNAVTIGGLASPEAGPWYFVYLIAVGGREIVDSHQGIAGMQCGLDYQRTASGAMGDHVGLDIFEWTGCASAEYRADSWPAAGSSNLIVWDYTVRCQPSHQAIAGYFYVGAYGADMLQLTARPADRKALVATCYSVIFPVDGVNLGQARFGPAGSTVPGCNPCLNPCPAPGVPVPPPPPPPPPPTVPTAT